jgi:hypothetical protein
MYRGITKKLFTKEILINNVMASNMKKINSIFIDKDFFKKAVSVDNLFIA